MVKIMNSEKSDNQFTNVDEELENDENLEGNRRVEQTSNETAKNADFNKISKKFQKRKNNAQSKDLDEQELAEYDEGLEVNLIKISNANEEIKARIIDIQNILDQKSKIFSLLESKIEFLSLADEDFAEWKQRKANSFATKLIQRLNEAKIRLDKDELLIRNWLKDGLDIDLNFVRNARNWFVKRYLVSTLVLGLTTLLLYILNSVNTQEYSNLLSFLRVSVFEVYIFSWFLYLIYLINLSTSYSRKWSRHRRELDIASAKAANYMSNIDYIKDARQRIDSLHPQVIQYLQLLSAAIHMPWKVSDELIKFKSSELNMDSFPEGVDIASPDLANNEPQFKALVDKTVACLFAVKGWREQAFNTLISKIASSNGIAMTLADIDRDSRRNGLKSLTLKVHNESVDGSGDLLSQLAKEKIRQIVPLVQDLLHNEVKDSDHLKVASLKNDPLADLELGEDLIDEPKNQLGWNEYLQTLAGPAVAWSPLVFSNQGILNERQQKINRSFILGDKKFAPDSIEFVEFIDSSTKYTRPVDLLLRVDLSDWCSAVEVKIFEGMPVSEIEEKIENKFQEDGISTEGTAI